MNEPYTVRELDERFKDVTDTLQRILEQTTKTNGRVSALEKWMWMCLGGGGVTVILIIPLILQFFKNQL